MNSGLRFRNASSARLPSRHWAANLPSPFQEVANFGGLFRSDGVAFTEKTPQWVDNLSYYARHPHLQIRRGHTLHS